MIETSLFYGSALKEFSMRPITAKRLLNYNVYNVSIVRKTKKKKLLLVLLFSVLFAPINDELNFLEINPDISVNETHF